MIAKSVVIFLFVLQVVPLILLLERKLLGRFQSRIGPNRVGPYGLLQPLADVLKLLSKEASTPNTAVPWMMALAPVISIFTAVVTLAIIPFGDNGDWGGNFGLYGIDVPIGDPLLLRVRRARLLRADARRLGVRLEVLVPRRDALRRPAHLLRDRARPVAARRGDPGAVDVAHRDRPGAAQPLVRGAAVRRLLHLPCGRLRRDQPPAVRPRRGRLGDRRRLQHRVRRHALRLVLHGRVHQHDRDRRHRHRHVPRRLARAGARRRSTRSG